MSTRISGLLFNVSEELPCQREDGNRADSFAVAVVRGEAIVGHVPKKISVCPLYLTLGWFDRLPSNRIQTLLGGFSARPFLLLGVLCEICEILHHTKISRYTVIAQAVPN